MASGARECGPARTTVHRCARSTSRSTPARQLRFCCCCYRPSPAPHRFTPPPWLPQEVYGRLEDPDGLQGLVRLRQGGPRPEDQRLAAEKAGNWSEALTLYEQALQHSRGSGGGGAGGGGQAAGAGAEAAAGVLDGDGGASAGGGAGGREAGLGPMQRSYLDCLLHMGHLQGLLTQASPLVVMRCAEPLLAGLPTATKMPSLTLLLAAGWASFFFPPCCLHNDHPLLCSPALRRWRAWQARQAPLLPASWPRWAPPPPGAWASGSASRAMQRSPARHTRSWMLTHAGR